MAPRETLEIKMRAATCADAVDIATVHYAGWQESYKGVDSQAFSLDKCVALWQDVLSRKDHAVSVVQFLNMLVGVCSIGPSTEKDGDSLGQIYEFHVLPPCYGLGIRTVLLARSLHHLKAHSLLPAHTWALVHDTQRCEFYERNGGRLVGSRMITRGDKQYEEVNYLFDNSDIVTIQQQPTERSHASHGRCCS